MKKARTVKISKLFCLVVVFLFLAIIVKLSYVVLSKEVDGINLAEYAKNRNTVKEKITAERGTIYDSLDNVLAINVNSYTVIAFLSPSRTTDSNKPEHVVDKEMTAEKLSPLINMTKERLIELLSTDAYQVELGPGGRGITELLKEEIEKLNLPGISFMKSVRRYYPNNDFLSYTLGYAKTTEEKLIVGEMGLELKYNDELTGVDGSREYESDIYGYKIANTNEKVIEAKSGQNIYLTIDTNIQMFVEQAITKIESASYYEWATISVVNAKTGEILGVASSPSFDPNIKEIVNYYDPFVSYTYEPGSTMKTFSFMAAIENGLYNGDETYYSGHIDVGEYRISDWNSGYGWGTITFDQGYFASSNVAATLLSQRLGGDKLKDFYKKLGLGKKTGINLPNEQKGKLDFKYEVEVANASFGQGMTVTPVQMVQALTSIANDGVILKPYIVKKIEDPSTGEILFENKRTEVRKAASKQTIDKIKEMMWGVVNSEERMASGTAYKTDIVTTIGKTGTAQIADPNGGYLTGYNEYIRSFAGLFPYEDPEILVYVVVSKITDQSLISEATKTLIEDVSTYLGIVNKDEQNSLETYKTSSYINKKVEDVKKDLENKKINLITIGNGDKVINQYPKKNSILNANDKLFLLTNSTDLKYVNIEGWSKSDLNSYANLLGVTFTYNGYGYVTGSNITDRVVTKGEVIEVTLKPKYIEEST